MKTYKLWLEIEEIDEENDVFENVVEPHEVDEFSTLEEAQEARDKLLELAEPGPFPFSVLLAYSVGDQGIETYFTQVFSTSARAAAVKAQVDASEANDGVLAPEEFEVLAVIAGHIELELGVYDF